MSPGGTGTSHRTEREDETVDGASGPPTVSIDGRLAIGLFS
jgi:hypothetical protein